MITNRQSDRRAAGRFATDAANVVREPRRDIKLDGSSRYKTSATVNEPSSERSHNSPDAGIEILRSNRYTHSPRHLMRGKTRQLDVHELALGSGRIDRGGVIYRDHYRGNGDSPHIDASGPQQPRSWSCNTGSEHVQAGKPGRNLLIGKCDDQDGARSLDSIAIRGNAEMMGPKGARRPDGQVSLRRANFAARRFLHSHAYLSCDLETPS